MVARGLIGIGNKAGWATIGRLLRVVGLGLLCCFGLNGVAKAAQLRQATHQAFSHYVARTEDRMAGEIHDPNGFLWVDRLPPEQRQALMVQLHQGVVVTQELEALENGQPILVPHGMVHHWVATVFVPGVDLGQTLIQQQDYGRSTQIYGPDVERCKVLEAKGNNFRVYYRLRRKAIVTVTYNAEFDIQFVPVGGTREESRSYSRRIAEVVDAGLPSESERPAGTDRGYLWRLNTYTRYDERDGGVYIQIEFLALSRSVPAVFAWLVNPYVKSIPQDYLIHILGATRNDLMDARREITQAESERDGAVRTIAASPSVRLERVDRARGNANPKATDSPLNRTR